jgi:hypothetical protein
VPQIDPLDDSRVRYVIQRHTFDNQVKFFRWINERAFDNKKEFEIELEEAFRELHMRRQRGEADAKEQVSGMKLGINHFANSSQKRIARQELATYLPNNLLNRIRVSLSFLRRRLR